MPLKRHGAKTPQTAHSLVARGPV